MPLYEIGGGAARMPFAGEILAANGARRKLLPEPLSLVRLDALDT